MSKIYNLSIIRDLCRIKNISHKELAERAGISKSGLQTILRENKTTEKTLQKLAETLEVDIGVFLAKGDPDANLIVREDQINYTKDLVYKDKYIKVLEEKNKLLEEYNNLLKEKYDKKECKDFRGNKENYRK